LKTKSFAPSEALSIALVPRTMLGRFPRLAATLAVVMLASMAVLYAMYNNAQAGV
jgi:hypothetical protein